MFLKSNPLCSLDSVKIILLGERKIIEALLHMFTKTLVSLNILASSFTEN